MPVYEDKYVVLDEHAITIKTYYFPWGSKRIPYDDIDQVREEELDFWSGKWRIWGTRKPPQWFHLDWNRPGKPKCIILETNTGWSKPVLTPESHEKVLSLLREKVR